jgi:hypothetical protein
MSTPPPLPPKPTPNWRRLDWWLGNTHEQIADLNHKVEEIKQAPAWFRGCFALFLLSVMAALVSVKGFLILIPTVGLIVIIGIHYLITGKVLSPPIPIWLHLAFWLLLLMTMFLAVGG